jgi:hypothetical protein
MLILLVVLLLVLCGYFGVAQHSSKIKGCSVSDDEIGIELAFCSGSAREARL